MAVLEATVKCEFQFTLPRGERQIMEAAVIDRISFNSRSRGGSDVPTSALGSYQYVSIHAPAGGATRGRQDLRQL